MEEIIERFNDLVQEMAEKVSLAKTIEEADKIQSEYDKIIDKAEKALEKDMEDFITKERDALEVEQKLAEIPLDELAGSNPTTTKHYTTPLTAPYVRSKRLS